MVGEWFHLTVSISGLLPDIDTVLHREGMEGLLKISIFMVTFLMVNCNQYELCGQVVKSVQNRFAIDGDGARIVAPWIVALGVKKDEDKDGFDEFNVKCTGSILTDNVVIREAHLENIFMRLYLSPKFSLMMK